MPIASEETKLKQKIGFFGLLAMSVGINIGGSVFALTTIAAGMTGPSLPLALLIASLPAILAVVPYCVLTSSLPTTSASYRYVQLISPRLASISAFTLLTCMLIGAQPMFALIFGRYLGTLVPINPIVSGLVLLTFFYIINMLGVGPTAKIQTFLLFVLLVALCLFVVMGLPKVEAVRFTELFPKGVGGLLTASGLLFVFCGGGFFAMDVGGEVLHAKRNLPKALFFGILIVVIMNFLITVVVVGVAGPETLQGTKSLIHVAELFMPGPVIIFFAIAGALVACATTTNAVFTVIGRGLMVVAQDDMFPKFLGKVSKRFGTPHYGLTVSYIISALSLIFIPSLLFYGSMLNLGVVFSITLVAVAGFLFPKKYPKLFAKSTFKISPRLTRIACISVISLNVLITVFFMKACGNATFVYFGIVAVGVLYTLSRKKVLESFDILSVFPALKEDT